MRKVILGLLVVVGAATVGLAAEQLAGGGSIGPAALIALALMSLVFAALLATYLLLPTRHRMTVLSIWLACFSVAITYLVLDVVAGWALIRPLSPPLVPDQARHHKLVPDSYAEFNQRDFSYVQRVNKHGLRGQEIATEKAPGTFRILMLGDSFTMGKGVEDDQTFSVVLQNALNSGGRTCGRTIEVLNGGVDSYAPVLSLIELKELASLRPDMVIENLDASDLVQEIAYRKQAERGPDGEIVAVPQRNDPDSVVDKFRSWTERHLYLTRLLLFYAIRASGHREINVRNVVTQASPETLAHTLEGDVDRTTEWTTIFESIDKMHQFAASQGMMFLLTTYPWPHQINDREWVPGRYTFMAKDARPSDVSNRTIHAMSAAKGIPLLDATPTFKSYAGSERLYFDYDMHWTVTGQAVMAKALEEYLYANVAPVWCAQ